MGKRSDKSPKRKGKKAQKVVVKHPKRVAYGATWRLPVEKKNIDFQSTALYPTAAITWSNPLLVNGVSQGAGATQYIGRSLMLKKMMFRYTFTKDYSDSYNGAERPAVIRLVVVYDKSVERNSSGTIAVPAATDIFTVDEFGSYNNLGNSERFCILYDKFKIISPSTNSTNGSIVTGTYNSPNSILFFKANLKLNHLMQFVGTTNLIASIEKGAIYMMACQNGNMNNLTGVESQLWCRFRFVDS